MSTDRKTNNNGFEKHAERITFQVTEDKRVFPALTRKGENCLWTEILSQILHVYEAGRVKPRQRRSSCWWGGLKQAEIISLIPT